MTTPCLMCGEPENAPIHDDGTEVFLHSYTDDGAPTGYEDSKPSVRKDATCDEHCRMCTCMAKTDEPSLDCATCCGSGCPRHPGARCAHGNAQGNCRDCALEN